MTIEFREHVPVAWAEPEYKIRQNKGKRGFWTKTCPRTAALHPVCLLSNNDDSNDDDSQRKQKARPVYHSRFLFASPPPHVVFRTTSSALPDILFYLFLPSHPSFPFFSYTLRPPSLICLFAISAAPLRRPEHRFIVMEKADMFLSPWPSPFVPRWGMRIITGKATEQNWNRIENMKKNTSNYFNVSLIL